MKTPGSRDPGVFAACNDQDFPALRRHLSLPSTRLAWSLNRISTVDTYLPGRSMRILFLSRWRPYPADNGSKIRIFNILRQLAASHEVSLLTFDDVADRHLPEHVEGLSFCMSARAIPYRPFEPARATAMLGFLSRQPRSLASTYSSEMHQAISEELRRRHFDLVVASQLSMLPYALEFPEVPAILEELELTVFRDAVRYAASPARRIRAELTWWKLASYLRSAVPRLRACTVASEAERANLKSIVPDYGSVAVIPNAVDAASYSSHSSVEPFTLVFSGALTYEPNADAMRYFLSSIYPRVRHVMPQVKLRITGRNAGFNAESLADPSGVELTGHMEDVRPLIAASTLSVVPLRRGGGTRLKILEAMALGTPVVSTSKGAEGLNVRDGESIGLADDPHSFANRVIELLTNPHLRARLAMGGRRLVEQQYDWSVIGEDLRRLVHNAAHTASTGRYDTATIPSNLLPGSTNAQEPEHTVRKSVV